MTIKDLRTRAKRVSVRTPEVSGHNSYAAGEVLEWSDEGLLIRVAYPDYSRGTLMLFANSQIVSVAVDEVREEN